MLRAIFFSALISSALADENLDVLVNAASSFTATIAQQLEMLDSNPSAREFAKKTIDYAEAKTAYFEALSAAMPGIRKKATGQGRSPELDTFVAALAIAAGEQNTLADQKTRARFKEYPSSPQLERAREEFEHAQKAEDKFHQDYDTQLRGSL
jgi:hypothetical protein